jgi:hypothetical protein
LNNSRQVQGRVFAFSAIRVLLGDQPVTQPKGFAAFALQKQAAGRQVTLEVGVVEAFADMLTSNLTDH